MPAPYPRPGGGVLNREGFAAAPLTLALPGESVFFGLLPSALLITIAFPGEPEGKPRRGTALRKQNFPTL